MADAFPPPPRMSESHVPVAEPPPPVLSDAVLILICVVVGVGLVAGLAMVVRQAWLWLRRSSTEGPLPPSLSPPNGLNMEDLLALPRLSYEGAIAVTGGRLADCAICLAEFEEGDEIRVLPQCGHSFHVDCIDRWLSSHSSCPSCRQVVVVSVISP